MICQTVLGTWGVEAEGLTFDNFLTLCQICGYLNKTSPTKPTKKSIESLPVGALGEAADFRSDWYK